MPLVPNISENSLRTEQNLRKMIFLGNKLIKFLLIHLAGKRRKTEEIAEKYGNFDPLQGGKVRIFAMKKDGLRTEESLSF